MPLRCPRGYIYGDGTIDAYSFDSLLENGEPPADPVSVRFRSIAEIMMRAIQRCVAAESRRLFTQAACFRFGQSPLCVSRLQNAGFWRRTRHSERREFVSNEARHRDIAALLARGVIRVKRSPLAAKAIESHMPDSKAYSAEQSTQGESMQADEQSQGQVDSMAPIQQGGDQ
jgi:hypothetical protein